MQITNIVRGVVEKTLMQCIISYFEVLFSLNFWMKEGLLHHVEIFRQTGLFKNCQCIIQTSEIFTSSIWKNGHSRMEPRSLERYHLPSDSGLYLLYLLQNTKDKRRAVCFAQNVFLSEKKFVLICEVFCVMAKMLSDTSQNLNWNVESLAKRQLYLKI